MSLGIGVLILSVGINVHLLTHSPEILTIVKTEVVEKVIILETYDRGISSWYGLPEHGRKMANGWVFSMYDPTVVAHVSLPFGTRLLVTNLKNGKTIIVTVQDRLPKVWVKKGRIIDLSRAAAENLDFIRDGLVNVKIQIIREDTKGLFLRGVEEK